MSWFRLASELLREAMSSGDAVQQQPPTAPPPSDVAGMLAHHRAEIDKNLETIVGILNAQNERHLKAMKQQQRWNYALAGAVVVVAILATVAYWV